MYVWFLQVRTIITKNMSYRVTCRAQDGMSTDDGTPVELSLCQTLRVHFDLGGGGGRQRRISRPRDRRTAHPEACIPNLFFALRRVPPRSTSRSLLTPSLKATPRSRLARKETLEKKKSLFDNLGDFGVPGPGERTAAATMVRFRPFDCWGCV